MQTIQKNSLKSSKCFFNRCRISVFLIYVVLQGLIMLVIFSYIYRTRGIVNERTNETHI